MKSENFTEEEDTKLIDFVRNNHILYQSKPHLKTVLPLKDNLWLEIATTLDKEVIICKKRWRTIRDSYRRLRNKKKTNTNYYSKYNNEKLNFLDDIATEDFMILDDVFEKGEIDTTLKLTSSSSEEIHPEGILDDYSSVSKKKEKRSKKVSLNVNGNLTVKKKISKNNFLQENDISKTPKETHDQFANPTHFNKSFDHPIELFFKSMGKIVMQFPPNIIAETRVKVCTIVSEMELRALKEDQNDKIINHNWTI